MVEKIVVSRDEVLHYPWLDHTWVYLYYTKNAMTKNPLFTKVIRLLLKRCISETTGQKFESIVMEDGYVFVQYNTDEIVEIIKKACSWILKQNLTVKDPESPIGKFYIENKDPIYAFFAETMEIMEKKTYKYYFQSVDGMN